MLFLRGHQLILSLAFARLSHSFFLHSVNICPLYILQPHVQCPVVLENIYLIIQVNALHLELSPIKKGNV